MYSRPVKKYIFFLIMFLLTASVLSACVKKTAYRTPGNLMQTESLSGNISSESVKDDLKSADIISENAVSENAVSENTVSDNTVSENTVSENTVSENTATENAASDNRVTYAEGFYYESIPDDVAERIRGVSYPEGCSIGLSELRYLKIRYIDFDGKEQTGELICNRKIAEDLIEIFSDLYNAGYQIEKVRLIDEYGGDDDKAVADDNTSCFNYRTVAGTTHLSRHAYGMAVDINPFYNPYVTYEDGAVKVTPPGAEAYADCTASFPHKIDTSDLCCTEFMAHGFKWGGSWNSVKDYQHFQK